MDMNVPTSQADRDKLEGVTVAMRDALERAKALEKVKAIRLCSDCGKPCRAWGGIQEFNDARYCHVCRALRVMALMMLLPKGERPE